MRSRRNNKSMHFCSCFYCITKFLKYLLKSQRNENECVQNHNTISLKVNTAQRLSWLVKVCAAVQGRETTQCRASDLQTVASLKEKK